MAIQIQTQHQNLTFLADEVPYNEARYARLDLERLRVVSWHSLFPTPAYRECGSHKRMRKAYEVKYGKLVQSGEFPFQNGKLFDCMIKTQKNTYVNSLFGGQIQIRGGRKYDEKRNLK